jgi:hypothetical protein
MGGPVTTPRVLARGMLELIDVGYRRIHQLRPVGPVLHLGIARHAGAPFDLADGTRISRGEPIGRLHFDNSRAAEVQADGRLQPGVRYARLLRDSFTELAERAQGDDGYREVPLYEGITWFRPHGRAVGFTSEPLPPGLRKRWLATHFRLLVWAYAPTATERAIEPRVFRISRAALIENFARTARARLD